MPSRPPSSSIPASQSRHALSFVPFPDACVRPIKRVVPRQGLQPEKNIPIQLKTNPIKKIFKKIFIQLVTFSYFCD